ncbi:MAG: cysteine--tRNA ligase [Candidatus Bathyarchaeota archaeon]|nr:cysteine--tRNA ligase [Candidatus Bathyarchaeota archaeon]
MLKLFNTLTRKKEEFKPLNDMVVTMYNCGLTVYDYATIGNLRAFTFADILRRYLEYKGFSVKQVMNFTDVGHMFHDVDVGEDKMEAAVQREKKDPWAIAEFYIKSFMEDARLMNFEEPMVRPRASEHIAEMIDLIKKLAEKGYAYVVNGSVYFDVSKFKSYGQLSGNTVDKMKLGAGGRVDFNPDKRNQFDFALWINDPRHIMNWKSPWCEKGYPGWHIECSAMSMKYLGETIDIHTGGVDNLFPHHENEIAQSEAATSKKFVNYWLHVEHLQVEGKPMHKSLGNFYTLKDIIAKGYNAKALRFLLLSTHYRQQLNFTFAGLEASKNAVDRLRNFVHRLLEADGAGCGDEVKSLIARVREGFEAGLDDDLNVGPALAALFDFVRDVNRLLDENRLSREEAEGVYGLMMEFDKVLGVIGDVERKEKLPKEAEELIRMREEARKAKDWKTADQIREKLRLMGIVVEDTPEGVRWRVSK